MKRIVKSKPFQFLLVLFLVASIVATGTYAWNDFLGRKTVFTPSVAPPQVKLVDFSNRMGEVYVVNDTGQEVLVRIRLSQYLALGGRPVCTGMLKEDVTTWLKTTVPEISKYYRLVFSNAVLSMSDWKASGAPEGDYWVADSDGWYYYAKRLTSGETTRILLQEIVKSTFNEPVGDDYGIQTTLQAVPREELNDLLALDKQDYTYDGALLMKALNGEMVTLVQ